MKTNNNIEYWDLLAKYYSNECSHEEMQELFNWLKESNENEILFNKVKQDLELININKSMNKVNVDSAWEKLKNRIEEDEEIVPVVKISDKKAVRFISLLKYAAIALVLISVGLFSTKVYQKIENRGLISEIASINEQGKVILLPDGTSIILNSDSKLTYPEHYAANERRVKLEGEAYFDVTKNPEQPFIIETKNAEVKVLGTTFNVNANLPNDQVEVYVETGLVQLSSFKNSNSNVLIKPGDVGIIENKNLYKKSNDNKNIISWKTKEIVFKEQYLSDVLYTLNKIYNTHIICEDQEVLDLRYTSTFRNQEINSILNVICLTFDLKTEVKGDRIYLIKHKN